MGNRYREQYCTFNDDIQGTASVAVSGLMASTRVTGKKLTENKFLFLGAGEAAIGIADLTVKALEKEGMSLQEARDKIWMVDIDGLLAVDRPEGGLDGHKKFYAKQHPAIKDFAAIVKEVKPSVLIGEFLSRPIISLLRRINRKLVILIIFLYSITLFKF